MTTTVSFDSLMPPSYNNAGILSLLYFARKKIVKKFGVVFEYCFRLERYCSLVLATRIFVIQLTNVCYQTRPNGFPTLKMASSSKNTQNLGSLGNSTWQQSIWGMSGPMNSHRDTANSRGTIII